jgi:two-component system, OmpR family, sensor kinase
MSRIPIRLRVTLVFAAAMAIVLGGAGLIIYLRLGSQLDESIDNGLRSRAGDVGALVEDSKQGLGSTSESALIEGEESLAQVLAPDGRVVDSTPQLQGTPVLSPTELERAAIEPAFFERGGLPGIEGAARLLATPAEDARGRDRVAVVGSSLDDRDEALASLATLLLVGGPLALLVTSAVGYGVAAAALRPVEAMRRRAAQVSADDPSERLPIARAGDEISRLGETLNLMLDRLEAALERERRFVDDASHELRTPLALHKTELEVALRYASDERELRAAIGSSIAEVDRLIQLAEDLLVVARSDENGLALKRERVPVEGLLETVRERFTARAAQLGRSVVVEDSGELAVDGDRLRLEQALTSMVDNALRYGGGEIQLRAEPVDGRIALHVVDRGPGFPPGFADRAFERFAMGDPARGRGGSGLGLAIVETIARAHGGVVGARNGASGGADVWLEIPASER